IVFFPSYVTPEDSGCESSPGTGTLYALFYLTGSAYTESAIGTESVGGNTNVMRSVSVGSGMASQVAVHIGAQGTDAGTGVSSRATVCSQTSTGALTCTRSKPA
ncbi:hypothetical protein MYX04_15065, partial [Nitrospiraceae bacterium AH_259_D15_M11_P09]|nr:hypothetical protein [Nitrospiraceae bacterium AH_259_D15_M11_P09]